MDPDCPLLHVELASGYILGGYLHVYSSKLNWAPCDWHMRDLKFLRSVQQDFDIESSLQPEEKDA